MQLFKDYMLKIIEFCARQCEGNGELSVARMVGAYNYASERWSIDKTIGRADVLKLAEMIEPEKNAGGYRQSPGEDIEGQMTRLLDNQHVLSPLEFLEELGEIRPLPDGTRRLAAILFNLKSGNLFRPKVPPAV